MNTKSNITAQKFGRSLVWCDEFSDASLDTTKWAFERLMYNPVLLYDNSEKNCRLEDGMLHLQVNKVADKFSTCNSVTTKHSMLFRYGYVEMRARLPFRHGAWPSFWMQSATPFLRKRDGRNNWFSEIDIFEVFSKSDELSVNIHRWGNIDGTPFHEMLPDIVNGKSKDFKFENSESLCDEFHTYGMLWEKDCIKFSVDDVVYFDVPIDNCSMFNNKICDDMMGFHDPHYLIINNEVFTDNLPWYPKGAELAPDEKMPIDYYIDYVRLYQSGDNEKIYLGDSFK